MPVVLLGNMAASGLLGAVLWNAAGPGRVAAWVVAIYLLTAIRGYFVWRYRNTVAGQRDSSAWARLLIGFSLASGCLWGSAGALLLTPQSLLHMTALTIGLMGMIAGAVASMSTLFVVYAVFAIPAFTPLTVQFFLLGGVVFYALGGMAVFFLLVNLAYGRNVQRSVHESLMLRHENIELLDQLRHQKERAEQASLDKSRFLAAASHDLRQPLHALGLFLGALEDELTEPDQRLLLDQAEKSADAMKGMFDALLDVSKLDAGAVEPQVRDIELAPILDSLRTEFESQARERGLSLRIRSTRAVVCSDPVLLQRILRNLLSNAIRHSRQGGVLLGVRRHAGGYRCEVHDTGPGIARRDLNRVFAEFEQLGNPERDRSRGLGLGLAIVRRLTDLLGHPLSVESAPGRGSSFGIELPAGRPQAVTRSAPAPALPGDVLRGMRVLIIDDERSILESMASLLERWGCEVLSADCASAAVALFRGRPLPQVVIADYRLREHATGAEAIAAVQEAVGTPVPGILITGDTDPARIREARDSGYLLLHKPVSPAQLRLVLSRFAPGQSRSSAG